MNADGTVKIKRERPRMTSLSVDRAVIAERVKKFYDDDNTNRADEIQARLQRYAKYRMWTEGRDWPWEDATDAAIPDMTTASMRLQDTLHNAVMSQRPCVMAKAIKKAFEEKEDTVNKLIDAQIFIEQQGEEIIGTLAHNFVNDGSYTAYVPWVKETRHVVDLFVMAGLQEGEQPINLFRQYLEGKFPGADLIPAADGWDWKVEDQDGKQSQVSFFTRTSGEVEIEIEHEGIRFEGPRIIPKEFQDVLHPVRCDNLQIPGPSNPLGAAHVILRDYPTVDEIKRLSAGKNPFYDMVTDDELKQIGIVRQSQDYQEQSLQKDIIQGAQEMNKKPTEAKSHEQLTRLMVFDCFDIDNDGKDEDIIVWMILETKTVLRVRYLTQMFPSNPPMRPLAEGHLFRVPERRSSIGILEMMEGLHDLQKQFFDQMGDSGTIATTPFFFYRAASNMRPETIRLWPGEGYPLNDPVKDVNFPNIGNQHQSFGFNMTTMIQQMEERLTTIGDLQLGRVPQGKSSALRTVSGMQTVLSQGDARPERVLRRFFIGLTQIWRIVHSLNRAFLPKDKQFRIVGYTDKVKDPYMKVGGASEVDGEFVFDFSANALNTSKEATQMALQDLMGVYMSQLAMQMGLIEPDGVYRLLRDYGRAKGQDPDKYLSAPTPQALHPKVFAEEAVAMIMDGQLPQGMPAEGAEAHLQALQEFVDSDNFGLMDQEHATGLFRQYMERIAQMAMAERQRAAMLQAAQQFSQTVQQPGKTGPQAMPQDPGGNAPVHGAELLDETLPGAGGGANVGVAA